MDFSRFMLVKGGGFLKITFKTIFQAYSGIPRLFIWPEIKHLVGTELEHT